jgi:hypothetical protein
MKIGQFFGRKKWSFQKATFKESKEVVRNPERGWYQVYSFDVSKEVDFDELVYCLREEETIVLLMLDIGSCRDRRLTDNELERTRNLFQFFIEHQKDIILRIVYDREGKGMEKEPSTLSKIQEHMKQLGDIILEYASSIFVLQGLFIGSWGEMHSSKFLSEKHLVTLYNSLVQATDSSCTIAVRKPAQWRMIQSEKVALFDDAMFASDTHLGTFGTESRPAWTKEWLRKDEFEFIDRFCNRLPNGGEAVKGEKVSASVVIDTLEKMHICYLNGVYDERILKEWKESTLYDEITLRLGYRFVIREVLIKKDQLEIVIKNVGFGNLTKDASLCLIARNEQEEQRYEIDTDVKTWDAGKVCRIKTPIVNGELYLTLYRKTDRRVIYFANEGATEEIYLGTVKWRK